MENDEVHYPTRPVDKDKAESELVVNIKKATNPDETAPKQKHVRSTSSCIVTGAELTVRALMYRVYRIYMGLSFVHLFLDRLARAAHPC